MIKVIFIFSLCFLLLVGCATLKTKKNEPVTDQEEVEEEAQQEVEEEIQQEAQESVVEQQKEGEKAQESAREEESTNIDADLKEQADVNAEVQGLKHDVAFVKGEFENRDVQLKSLEEKVLQSLASLEGRIEELEKNLGQSKPQEKVSAKTTSTSLYEKGKNEITDKKYRQAILSFQLLLERYPTSSLVDDAHYWIGETYFLLDDCQRAILEYDIVRKKYPQGTAIASSLYNEAMCFEKLGSLKESQLLLEDLVSTFPDHPKSKMAVQKLKTLKKG